MDTRTVCRCGGTHHCIAQSGLCAAGVSTLSHRTVAYAVHRPVATDLRVWLRAGETDNRRPANARELLDEELGAFFEGRYAASEKAAARAMELGDTSALHPIIAARSAHELREYKKRDAYLSAAEGKTIGDSTMRLMTTSKFLLDQRDPRGALDALQELRDSGVKGHIGAMSLELKAHQQAG